MEKTSEFMSLPINELVLERSSIDRINRLEEIRMQHVSAVLFFAMFGVLLVVQGVFAVALWYLEKRI